MSVNPNAGDGDDDGGILPSWFPTSIEGFRRLVVGIVLSAVVAWVVQVGGAIVSSILAVLDSAVAVGRALATALGVLGLVSRIPELALGIFGATATWIATMSGPFAPVIVVGLIAIGVVVSLWTIRRLIDLILALSPIP